MRGAWLFVSGASALQAGLAPRALRRGAVAWSPTIVAIGDDNIQLAGTSAEGAEAWDEAWGTGSFADMELKAVWERTGKGKKRWSPGDTTGDAAVDASLLYSTWVMNRPDLYARDECTSCSAVRFALGHLGFPFNLQLESQADAPAGAATDFANGAAMTQFRQLDVDGNGYLEGDELKVLARWVWGNFGAGGTPLTEAETDQMVEALMAKIDENSDGRLSPAEFKDYFGRSGESSGAAYPRFDGQGVPDSSGAAPGLVGALPICSFAAAHAKQGRMPPASGRADVAAWLAKAEAGAVELDALAPMLRGVHASDQSPCLNGWGFTMDDALVLPHLRGLAPSAADLEEQWPPVVRAYLEMASERCAVPLLDLVRG